MDLPTKLLKMVILRVKISNKCQLYLKDKRKNTSKYFISFKTIECNKCCKIQAEEGHQEKQK